MTEGTTTPAEREAIVRWLRNEFRWPYFRQWAGWNPFRWALALRFRDCFQTADAIADAIERGDHLPSEQGEGYE